MKKLLWGGLVVANAALLVLAIQPKGSTEQSAATQDVYYMIGFGHNYSRPTGDLSLASVVVPFKSMEQCEAAGSPMRAAEGSKRNLDTFGFRYRYACVKGVK